MNKSRPVNLDLGTIRLPITAIASILHRVCAVISWVGLGLLLVGLSMALESKQSFDALAASLQNNFLVQFVVWGLLSGFGYYCAGTLKHLIQDFGFCEDFAGGKVISWVAILSGVVLSVMAGVLVWA